MTDPTRTFSNVARRRRKDLGISQELLSWMARVSRNTVSKIERGGASDPDGLIFDRLNAVLGLRTAFFTDGSAHPDAGDDIAFVDAHILRWFAEMFDKMRETDEVAARKAADAYMAFMDALSDVHEGSARVSVMQAVHETAAEMMTLMRPFLPAGLSEGPVMDFLRDAGWSPEDQGVHAPAGVLPSLRGSFHGDVRPPQDSEVEQLRARLREEEEKRFLIERHAADMRQRAEDADRATAELQVYSEAAQAFGRLPRNVQNLLMSGHVRDWSVIPGRGMSHVRLTVQPEGSEPVTAAEVMDQALLVDYALMASLLLVRRMREHNWDYRNIMPDMPDAVDTVAQDLRAVMSAWFEELAGQDRPAPAEGSK